MNHYFSLTIFILLSLCTLPGTVHGFQGPLYIRNTHPLFLGIGSPLLISAVCEDSLDLNFNYSSTFLLEQSQEWTFGIDLEAAVADIQFKKSLTDTTELSIDIPLISLNSGFLDDFLEWYHDTFGFSDYGRSKRPKNDFLFAVTKDGRTVIKGNPGEIALGDIKIGIKKTLFAGRPLISLYAFLELPTGDPDRGYGNGDLDRGVALLMNTALHKRLMAYVNAGIVFTDKFRAKEDVSLRNYLYGGAGVEWTYSERLSLYIQFFAQGSPFDNTGVREIDEPATILSFGSKYAVGEKTLLEFSFSEDTNTASAPDFMIAINGSYTF